MGAVLSNGGTLTAFRAGEIEGLIERLERLAKRLEYPIGDGAGDPDRTKVLKVLAKLTDVAEDLVERDSEVARAAFQELMRRQSPYVP